jgi:hypothetical protein
MAAFEASNTEPVMVPELAPDCALRSVTEHRARDKSFMAGMSVIPAILGLFWIMKP